MPNKAEKTIPTRHQGIPRNYKIARKLGYKKSKLKLADLGNKLQSQFVQLAEHGAREHSLCGVAPSTNPGYWLVCYKDTSGNCNWVDVPKGTPIPHD
jgi:hypothetical protein